MEKNRAAAAQGIISSVSLSSAPQSLVIPIGGLKTILRDSLETSFSHEIFIFSRKLSSFSLVKIGIPQKNSVPKTLFSKGFSFFHNKLVHF